MFRRLIAIVVGAILFPVAADAQSDDSPLAGVRSFLTEHCFHCHDRQTTSGGIDLSSLGNDLTDAEVTRVWTRAHDRVAAGEMPPADETPPGATAREAFLKSLAGQLRRADQARKEVVFRRLYRLEFENTMRDLFGLPDLELQSRLPEDTTAYGVDTVGEALSLSTVQMMSLLETVDFVEVVSKPEKY